jgi:hypothetical protein
MELEDDEYTAEVEPEDDASDTDPPDMNLPADKESDLSKPEWNEYQPETSEHGAAESEDVVEQNEDTPEDQPDEEEPEKEGLTLDKESDMAESTEKKKKRNEPEVKFTLHDIEKRAKDGGDINLIPKPQGSGGRDFNICKQMGLDTGRDHDIIIWYTGNFNQFYLWLRLTNTSKGFVRHACNKHLDTNAPVHKLDMDKLQLVCKLASLCFKTVSYYHSCTVCLPRS